MINNNARPTPLRMELTALCSLRCRSMLRLTFKALGVDGFMLDSSGWVLDDEVEVW